jgi:hypothetical protein
MRARLKRIHSPDIDLDNFWPENSEDFGFLIQAFIGPENESSEESLDMMVCTPDWIKRDKSSELAIWGRHYLIVFEPEVALIRAMIDRYVNTYVGKTWEELAERIGRIGKWEFEDYVGSQK